MKSVSSRNSLFRILFGCIAANLAKTISFALLVHDFNLKWLAVADSRTHSLLIVNMNVALDQFVEATID